MLRCCGGCEAAGAQPFLALREATGSGGKVAWAGKTMTSFSGWEGMGRDGPFFRRNQHEYMMKQPRICVPQFFWAQTSLGK